MDLFTNCHGHFSFGLGYSPSLPRRHSFGSSRNLSFVGEERLRDEPKECLRGRLLFVISTSNQEHTGDHENGKETAKGLAPASSLFPSSPTCSHFFSFFFFFSHFLFCGLEGAFLTHFVGPQKFSISPGHKHCLQSVSWDIQSSQEKLKTMFMQTFFFFLRGWGGGAKCIMGYVEAVNGTVYFVMSRLLTRDQVICILLLHQ